MKTDAFVNRVRAFLESQEQHFHNIEPQHIETIIEYLTVMDVLMKLPEVPSLSYANKEKYIFTQVGLKYIQLLRQVLTLRTFEEFIRFAPTHQELISSILEENILENLLEDVVIGQLVKEFWNPDALIPEYEFGKYTDIASKEIDIAAINHKLQSLVLFEVKYAKTRDENQSKHLADSEFCKEIESKTGMRIKNKVVLYRGESVIEVKTKNIIHLNAGEFLCNSDSLLPLLFTVDCAVHQDEITKLLPTFRKADTFAVR